MAYLNNQLDHTTDNDLNPKTEINALLTVQSMFNVHELYSW